MSKQAQSLTVRLLVWLASRLSEYDHIQGYLYRWRLFSFGRLSVRLHKIVTPDGTPFLHTHPFSYLSIVLSGGYDEQYQLANGELALQSNRPGTALLRSSATPHRISLIHGTCWTLFFAFNKKKGRQGWTLFRHASIEAPASYINWPDGIYRVKGGYRKRANGFWFALRPDLTQASCCDKISIRQSIDRAEKIPHQKG